MQYAQTIQPGGTVDFLGRSLLKLEAGANVHGEVGALLSGSFEVVPFSTIKLDGSATLHLLSGATETLDAGSFVNANGTINVNASGSTGLLQICNNGVQNVLSGGLLDIKGDGSTSGSGDVILRSGALLEGKSGSAIRTDGSLTVEGGATVDISTAALNLDGTAISWGATSGAVETGKHTDASTVTRTGPTIQSGVSGYVGHRERYLSGNATGTENIATSQYEIIVTATTQTGDVVFNLADPPNGERLDITICVFAARTNGHQLTVQGSGGALFAVVGGTDDFWFDYRWSPGVGNWVKVRTGKFV
jgi:hypothetical protein